MGLFDFFRKKKKEEEKDLAVEEQKLESEALETEAEANQAELEVSESEAEVVETELEISESEVEANEVELEISESEAEVVEAELEISESEVEADEVELEISETEVEADEAKLDEGEVEAVETEDTAEEAEQEKKAGFFSRLIDGLSKTKSNISDKIDRLLNNYGEIDDELFDELEEILITADIGMDTSMELIDDLKSELNARKIDDTSEVKPVLTEILTAYLTPEEEVSIVPSKPTVIFVIGVNGAGKTTSIGKIANLLKSEGNSVLLAAADTFRAAAIDQLKVWSDRVGVDVIAHSEGSDPSAVVYDACQAAKARKTDVLIVDTAGRLHNKVNLMKELNKMFRTIEREFGDAHLEVLLVLDATTGQNAVQQAKLFKETAPITGLVLTKLDGTAKGGFVFAIRHLLNIPVKLIGVGEKINDLQHFDPEAFASAIME